MLVAVLSVFLAACAGGDSVDSGAATACARGARRSRHILTFAGSALRLEPASSLLLPC